MDVVIWSARLLLAVVFAEALWVHLRQPARLRGTLQDMGVRPRHVVALVTTMADAVVLGALIFTPSVGGWLAIGYLLVATATLAIAAGAGYTIADCGCGISPKPFDSALVARNVGFALAALLVAAAPEAAHADFLAGALGAFSVAMLKGLTTSIRHLAAV
jgi:hypothetical protein